MTIKFLFALMTLLIFAPASTAWADRLLPPLPVYIAPGAVQVTEQPADFLIRTYRIELEVECLEAALDRLNRLPGIVLSSHIHVQSDWGVMDRRVSNLALEAKLREIYSLGRVTHSETHTQNVFVVVLDLRSEFGVMNTEYGRLMELLVEVDTIENFSRVENRLVQVIRELERVQGRLNHFEFETGTSRVSIGLNAVGDVEPVMPAEGAFARIGQSFVSSAGMTLAVLQGILILFAYMSIPLAFLLAVGFCVLWVVLRRKRRRRISEVEVNDEETTA